MGRVRRARERVREEAGALGAPEDLARARSGAARGSLTDWLLVRGRGDKPLERRVDAGSVTAHSSSKRPSVEPGERAILYAAVWQAVYGVVEIVGEPDRDALRTRWAWRFPVRALTLVDDLERAPAVEEAGIFPQSLWRHSHIRLTPEQFERARALIEAAAE